mmetsp:Transcript_40126/g.110482  ORF Transcript_40126/g.110482 Transcript_40126/m.110482 type:complete len:81 (+) Transcript_40126:2149-2391(+)
MRGWSQLDFDTPLIESNELLIRKLRAACKESPLQKRMLPKVRKLHTKRLHTSFVSIGRSNVLRLCKHFLIWKVQQILLNL